MFGLSKQHHQFNLVVAAAAALLVPAVLADLPIALAVVLLLLDPADHCHENHPPWVGASLQEAQTIL
jgi:hypothetical protein